MTIASFAPTASTFLSATATTSNIILPTTGTPTIALVTNQSAGWVFVELGSSSAVVATVQGSLPVPPGGQIALTIGANTYIAAITLSTTAGVNITVGN